MNIINTRFFRAGVGTVIYTQTGEVALFERATHPVGVWQFQQGGIDLGEPIETTLWRELQEEIGLTKDDIVNVTLYPHWTVYQDINSASDASISRLGQAHRWYFLELKAEVTIDLNKATDDETANYRFVSFDEAIDIADTNKKHVYEDLKSYFLTHVLTNRAT
jgi:putative (di)nucleoside polyphosphate hydrolase